MISRRVAFGPDTITLSLDGVPLLHIFPPTPLWSLLIFLCENEAEINDEPFCCSTLKP